MTVAHPTGVRERGRRWTWVDAAQDTLETHPALVPLALEVPVRGFRLLDRGVPELILDPPEDEAASGARLYPRGTHVGDTAGVVPPRSDG